MSLEEEALGDGVWSRGAFRPSPVEALTKGGGTKALEGKALSCGVKVASADGLAGGGTATAGAAVSSPSTVGASAMIDQAQEADSMTR